MTARAFFVFGAGGHGKVVADVGRSAGLALAGFVDDAPAVVGRQIWNLPVIGWNEFLARHARAAAIALGVGDNGARQRCAARAAAAGVELVTLVHAQAVVAPTAVLGAGTVVMAGAVVNPDASVGDGCILNTGCVVEHDCELGAWVHLSPNAALGGAVRIGERTHVGLGAVVLPCIRLGGDVRVGAGAAVHRDVPDEVTVVGVPARELRKDKP